MDERVAADSNSGNAVDHSAPGLKQRTHPPTAGRKPAARPPILQPKSGAGSGVADPTADSQREALGSLVPSDERAAFSLDAVDADPLSETELQSLIQFFTTLDRWDKEAHGTQIM
jgi:hypothetical protein